MHVYPKSIGKFKGSVIKKAKKKSSPLPKIKVQGFNWSIYEVEEFRVALD